MKEVLEAFREAATLGLCWLGVINPTSRDTPTNLSIGVEIQLKILQALPPLLQNYAEDLKGNLLGEALLICSILQGSKMGVVNNTAAASTLSKLPRFGIPSDRLSWRYSSFESNCYFNLR